MRYVRRNILDTKDKYILQQCNCVSLYPRGLAQDLEEKFSGSCPYTNRRPSKDRIISRKEDRDIPGTLSISEGNGKRIINLFGQIYPGGPKYPGDLAIDREKYFSKALEGLVDFFEGDEDLIRISVPYKIGCGLAQGNWENYEKLLQIFENNMRKLGMNLEMTICKM